MIIGRRKIVSNITQTFRLEKNTRTMLNILITNPKASRIIPNKHPEMIKKMQSETFLTAFYFFIYVFSLIF